MKRKCLAVGIFLLFIGTSVVPTIAQDMEKSSLPPSRGNWLYVGGSGPGNYTKIQDAIDNASNGDTVFVYHGIYQFERTIITKAITLLGEGKNTTVLDGRYSTNMILLVTSSNVTISQFTLENCYTGAGWHQAIYLWGNPQLENICISNCIMKDNDKGVFSINTTGITISSCDIHDNKAQSIYCTNSTNITIEHCIINNNGLKIGENAYIPGGVSIGGSSHVAVDNCTITANEAWGFEVASVQEVEMQHNTFSSNTLGMQFESIPDFNVHDNYINNDGDGIRADFFQPIPYTINIIQNNTFSGNENGVLLQYEAGCHAHVFIENNSFIGNVVGINSMGINETVIVNNCILNSTETGINLNTCDRDTICANTIQKCRFGLLMALCNDTNISHNIFSDNDVGLQLVAWHNYYHNHIFNNNISGNQKGVFLYDTRNNNISDNLISNNKENGIILNSSENNTLYHNSFEKNRRAVSLGGFLKILYTKNHWIGNYWGRPRYLPKIIFNIVRIRFKATFGYPRIEIDWHPALKPYDIPTMK